ncbi:MAG: flavin reductase [Clostridioides sp.]|jgi:flavin reductase (DIM6/NTAB) family NADH-FMN oxidoreductase RutF|nr:flavin reductase [Clostridioides sp.]
MSSFKEIQVNEFDFNPFSAIGKEWMLITAKKGDKVNTMTASWGGVGVLWNKNVVFAFIRPQRFTKEFVDSSDSFSISFYDEKYRKELTYCGRTSGRDEDKIEKIGFKTLFSDDVPYFEESNVTLICKKLYRQSMDPNSFLYEELKEKNYPENDYHAVYVAEIEKILVKEK